MKRFDVYLYGMILKTTSFLLAGDYPKPDTYGEIKAKYTLTGGETGNCATVLQSLGCTVKMDGNHMGTETFPVIREFYESRGVDLSSLTYDPNYEGQQDYVLIDKTTRTPFSNFQSYFSDTVKRWNTPREEDIQSAKVAGIDPFFEGASEEAARLCHELGVSYVTIDCPYDGLLHTYAGINVLSNEFIRSNYPGRGQEELLDCYAGNGSGLTILTHGAKETLYKRAGDKTYTFLPYKIEAVSTLGAGDVFKAGCVYALLMGMTDLETVQFASACAAVACTHFPLPTNPPTLPEIQNCIHSRA